MPPPASPVQPLAESSKEQYGGYGSFDYGGDLACQGDFSHTELERLSQNLLPPPPPAGPFSSRRLPPHPGKMMPEDVPSLKKRLHTPRSPEGKKKSPDKKSYPHSKHREHRESDTSRSLLKRRHEVSPPVQRPSSPSVARTQQAAAFAKASKRLRPSRPLRRSQVQLVDSAVLRRSWRICAAAPLVPPRAES